MRGTFGNFHPTCGGLWAQEIVRCPMAEEEAEKCI